MPDLSSCQTCIKPYENKPRRLIDTPFSPTLKPEEPIFFNGALELDGGAAMSAVARARRPPSPAFLDPPGYARHRPERTLLYQLVEQHYAAFRELRAAAERPLPDFVQQEFEAYLKCGRLEEGFLRVRCEQCHAEKLVAFSCKKRGFCPSCGGRRMAETAALLADEVLPDRPLRQWVFSLPHALRFLLAINSEALTLVLGEVYRTISRHLT